MNRIILEIIEKRLKNIDKDFYEIVGGQKDFSEFSSKLEVSLKNIGSDICKLFLEELNNAVKNDPKRKKNWIVERKSDKNTLTTVFGDVEYERTYYISKNKENVEYKYLSDALVGITPHQRTDLLVEARLIEQATEISYKKSGKPYELSKQTVMQSIKRIDEIKTKVSKEEKRTVEYLYIEADEDHVANQDGPVLMPKIVYVHEAYNNVIGEVRKKSLKNVNYISGMYKTDDIWNEVNKYITERYDTDKIKKIYISGDGAGWIKAGVEYIEKSQFVLDKYHLNKSIMQATGHLPEQRFKIWDSINKGNKKLVKEYLEEAITCVDSTNRAEQVINCKTYILNNWSAIKIKITDKENIVGCSAEGHVSHVLSARLSSRPLGWCKDGVDKMARLRAFKFNGGNVYELLLNNIKNERTKLSKEYLRQIKKAMNININGNQVTPTAVQIGKRTGLYGALKNICYA